MKIKHGEGTHSLYFPVEVVDSLEAGMQFFSCPAYTASVTSFSPGMNKQTKEKPNPDQTGY